MTSERVSDLTDDELLVALHRAGDGETDATDLVQEAVDRHIAIGGGHYWRISRPIVVPSGYHGPLFGPGNGVFLEDDDES